MTTLQLNYRLLLFSLFMATTLLLQYRQFSGYVHQKVADVGYNG